MFFVLSKVLAFLVVPSNVILGIGIVGMLMLVTRFRRAGICMMVVSLLLMLVVGMTPIGIALIAALENRFPPGKEGGPPIANDGAATCDPRVVAGERAPGEPPRARMPWYAPTGT